MPVVTPEPIAPPSICEFDLFAPATRSNTAALIPAYFEGRHIRDVAARALRELDIVVVVDDGSTDSTVAEARRTGAEVIQHEVNKGKGAAIKTGLRALKRCAGIDYVILLDGDGQHLPEEIPAFLQTANETRAPLLIGNRMTDLRAMPFVRKMTNLWMSSQISRLCEQAIPDTQCGFRLLRRDLLAPLAAAESNNYDFETEMLVIVSRLGQRIAPVPVSTVYGEEKSKIHPVRDTIRFFKLLNRLGKKVAAAKSRGGLALSPSAT